MNNSSSAPVAVTPAITYSSTPKMEVSLLHSLQDKKDLSLAYTPGIADVSRLIQSEPSALFTHTFVRNNLAVISDGSAVLGLGNIGHKASYPVMEGKAMLFKRFCNIDAIPIIINTQDPDEFITTVVRIADSFGAINLEDIAAPQCFYIEEQLKKRLNIPVMHDDQHGTATVVLAAVLNALEITQRADISQVRTVVSGAGAAATAVIKLLLASGAQDLVVLDSQGIIHAGRSDLNPEKTWLALNTNPRSLTGTLAQAIVGADVFIGLSRGKLLTTQDVKTLAKESIIIAMANPEPEILPEQGLEGGAAVVATGRSDYPNQVNNALAFPGIFRGALNTRSQITSDMLIAAAQAIREYHHEDLSLDNLMPSILDEQVHAYIAQKVESVAISKFPVTDNSLHSRGSSNSQQVQSIL